MEYREALKEALKLSSGDAIFVAYRSMPAFPTPQGLAPAITGAVFEAWHDDHIAYWTEYGALRVEPLDHLYVSRPSNEASKKILDTLEAKRGGGSIVIPDMGVS